MTETQQTRLQTATLELSRAWNVSTQQVCKQLQTPEKILRAYIKWRDGVIKGNHAMQIRNAERIVQNAIQQCH
jgi:hypothetical protein